MFGRVSECTREVSKVLLATGAVVTPAIMASRTDGHRLRVDDVPPSVTSSRPARSAAPSRGAEGGH
jgi:hypothetical protein